MSGPWPNLSRWTGSDMKVASVPADTMGAIRTLFAELRYGYLTRSSLMRLPGGTRSRFGPETTT